MQMLLDLYSKKVLIVALISFFLWLQCKVKGLYIIYLKINKNLPVLFSFSLFFTKKRKKKEKKIKKRKNLLI